MFGSKYIIRLISLVFWVSFFYSCGVRKDIAEPQIVDTKKREVRATWMPYIYRNDFLNKPRMEARKELSKRISDLADAGINMIFFQVRAEGDSWFKSDIEPTSRFLTSLNKELDWDPLAFAISEAHKYGMELHAWFNPYRAWSNTDIAMPSTHPARKNPSWVIPYGKQLIFDPANPEYRRHLIAVLRDILLRYDVDGLHFDDYFYPYPKDGLVFEDDDSFYKYGISYGYKREDKDIWRRNNVNLFVDELNSLVRASKPWIRISVSPFGIYRNKSSYRKGSDTNGLQSYDDLYADVLHWVKEGWVDYVVPQVYWNFGNERADYGKLVPWWDKNVGKKSTLVIGQDIVRTMDSEQIYPKSLMSQDYSAGNSWWPSDEILKNYKGVRDSLKLNYQRTKALLPEVKGRLGKTNPPMPVTTIMEDFNEDGHMILWNDMIDHNDPEGVFMYAIYAVPEGYEVDIKNPMNLVGITNESYFVLPNRKKANRMYTFLITTINRFWQESEAMQVRIKL